MNSKNISIICGLIGSTFLLLGGLILSDNSPKKDIEYIEVDATSSSDHISVDLTDNVVDTTNGTITIEVLPNLDVVVLRNGTEANVGNDAKGLPIVNHNQILSINGNGIYKITQVILGVYDVGMGGTRGFRISSELTTSGDTGFTYTPATPYIESTVDKSTTPDTITIPGIESEEGYDTIYFQSRYQNYSTTIQTYLKSIDIYYEMNTDILPITFYGNDFNSSDITKNNFEIETNNVSILNSDIDNKYVSGFISGTSNDSYIRVKNNTHGYHINKVVVNGYSSNYVTSSDIKGSIDDTYASLLPVDEEHISGNMREYGFSNVSYIYIDMSNKYISSITFFFEDVSFSAYSLSDFIIGMFPNRDINIGLCLGSSGNYKNVKDYYKSMSSTDRELFELSSDSNIVTARNRYLKWASSYGDTTPFDINITNTRNNNLFVVVSDDNSIITIAVISLAIISILTTLLVIKKKHIS